MKPGTKYHRREGGCRVVKYYEDGPFEIDERGYSSIKDIVDRLDLPHTPVEDNIESDKGESSKKEAKTEEIKTEDKKYSKEDKKDKKEEKEENKKETGLELKFAGDGKWNVFNKITNKNINDVPLGLDEAKALI